ncbi:MAG: diadenosine tetraphosphatase [Sulfurovum sp. AS07-7]|nr:MAG: diadenosine tetraphosphatase [Sulfurovum sp. AS07-7]
MAVWAIGDIQGCLNGFLSLLKRINFDSSKDTLWIAGDLVNRGEDSLGVLEYLYSIKESVKIVLGNHDIKLIKCYFNLSTPSKSLIPILDSPSSDILINWLIEQPFLHYDYKLGYAMSHAGISPQFDLGSAIAYASRIEHNLKQNPKEWLTQLGNLSIDSIQSVTNDIELDAYIVSSFVAMRFCLMDGRFDFEQKDSPRNIKLKNLRLKPWFKVKNRKEIELKIIFGHWSTLGYYEDNNVLSLDTGCLWGRKLTAVRLDTTQREVIEVDCSYRKEL